MTTSTNPFPPHLEHLLRENEPLSPWTWLKIGGPARYFAEPTSEAELVGLVLACCDNEIPVRMIGSGSNLLIREAGFDGLVLNMQAPAFAQVSIQGNRIRCGGGAKLSHLITQCVGAGLAGLEHLVGIPGTVGGALHSNSGTLNGDIGQRVRSARLLLRDGSIATFEGSRLHFSTRASSLDGLAILDCELELEDVDPKVLTTRMQTLWIIKRTGQPSSDVRCAIAFVDPISASAADLIEQVGLRSASEGPVQMSASYPNFLIAGQGATSQQVLALTDRIRNEVYLRTGVQLQLHLKIW